MKSNQIARKMMNRSGHVLASGAFVVLAAALLVQGCAADSSSPKPGTGGSTSHATGGSTAIGTGGSTAVGSGGNTTVSTGGTPAVGSGGSTSTGTGGTTVASTGGSSAIGTGGAASTGSGGATVGGTGGGTAAPLCVSQVKAGACLTPTDSCAKNCGPKSADNVAIGSKSLTCSGATYVEGLCEFPAGDYACFKVSAATAMCPAATASGGACTATPCMPCSGYTDSTAAPKVGFCHCVNSKWTCGSTKEWPCKADGTGSTTPGGTGC